MMYSQNNETGVLEVLEIKILFAAQPWWAEFYRIFLKFFQWILHFGDGISETFLKKKKKKKKGKNHLNSTFYHRQGAQNL